jgi:hypothetical protein
MAPRIKRAIKIIEYGCPLVEICSGPGWRESLIDDMKTHRHGTQSASTDRMQFSKNFRILRVSPFLPGLGCRRLFNIGIMLETTTPSLCPWVLGWIVGTVSSFSRSRFRLH